MGGELSLCSHKGIDFVSQAGNFPCRIIFMNDTLGGCLAEGAYCLREFVLSGCHISAFYSDKDFLYCRAERRTQSRIPLAPSYVLTGPLDG